MAFSDRLRRALAFAFGPEGVAVATELETAVETVAPGELTLANAHILVGNAAGIGADVAMSGDVTIDNTGATTIGAKKVTAAKIALANGKILIGDAGGAATEQSVSGDVTIGGTGVTAIGADKVTAAMLAVALRGWLNDIRAYIADAMLTIATLATSGVAPEKFKTTTTCAFRIGGITYTKVATDNLTFTAAHTINVGAGAGSFWGVFLMQIDAAGAVSTKVPAADQVYASEAAAIAALPAPDAANDQIGYLTVEANANASWTANTDDLTPASDCQAANWYDLPAPATLPAAL